MKSLDIVNTIIAKEKGLDVRDVAMVNKYYWKTVRHRVSNLDSTAIFVRGLLTFTASKYNVNALIKKTILNIRLTNRSKKYGEIRRKSILDKNYNQLRLLLKQRDKIAKQYYELNW